MSNKLFDDSDEGDNDIHLDTNEGYAKSYNHFRKKELLKKFKDRGYNNVEDSDSSSGSESSEEDEPVDAKFDQEFFKTLASLKSKDPAIYDRKTRFFEGLATADDRDSGDRQKRIKPVTIKDYERQILLEQGKFEDSDEDSNGGQQRAASPTVVEEERRLKAEFQKVLTADDSDEEFGGIFKKREKTKAETEKEEEDFGKWLAGKQEDIQKEHKEKLEPLKKYWSSQNLPQSERFLRDYILNQGYADTNADEIPTYDEIVGDNAPLSEDEQELEKQAEFEHKYNFRFEEPDSEFVQRYPRTIENSVRRTDDKRKQKRQELKDRKQQEKEQKMKEFDLIKEMKRKEIEEKIRKLKAVTGNDEFDFKDEELENDFDPEAHDRRMQELFNDDYYQVDEGEEKPECPSDIEELKIDDWDNYDPKAAENDDGPHCEDDNFNMDCEYDATAAKQQFQQELIENTRARKGRKGRRNRFIEMIKAEKPVFNPEDEKTYGDYIEEYYKIDCEDVVADIPCRFKYVETTANDFGLTLEEILLAKNKELNQWASLKKATQIRPDYVEKKEQRLYKMKARNDDLKRKIFKSLYGDGSDDEEQATSAAVQEHAATAPDDSTEQESKKKKKRKANTASNEGTNDNVNVVNTSAAAKIPKLEESNGDAENPALSTADGAALPAATAKLGKKKKKKRKNKNPQGNANNDRKAPGPTKSATGNTGPTSAKANPFKGMQKSVGPTPQRRNDTGNKFKAKFRTGATAGRTENGTQISDERLKAYGINPRRFHKKQQYGNKQK